MVHPSKLDYNNPIHAIFDKKGRCVLKFETKDGSVSNHPNSSYQFKRKEISPKDTHISKIQVWHDRDFIRGFKFYSNNDVVL